MIIISMILRNYIIGTLTQELYNSGHTRHLIDEQQ